MLTFSITGIIFLFIFAIIFVPKILVIIDQYERGIVLTLGKYSHTLQPGLNILVPIVQRVIRTDIRIRTSDIPSHKK